MVEALARLALALVLVASAGLKLTSPESSRASLAGFGVEDERARWLLWGSLVATEAGLAVAIAIGAEAALWVAAGLMLLFAAVLVGSILRGRAGAPCACFGSRSVVGWRSVARNLALAGAFAAVALLPERDLSTDEWLGVGLGIALLGCAALAAVVLALAREVGMLRLRLGPDAALEIPHEGPPLGERSALIEELPLGAEAELAIAVFTSEGCRVCRALEPAVDTLAGEAALAVGRFDEARDREIWEDAAVPGSPYAVALGRDGVVLAKGTFNNLAQLESVIATAERRRRGAMAGIVGGVG